MPTRNVVIAAHQSQLIDQWVTAGDYQNASEVLRDAVHVGIADIEAGRFETFFRQRPWQLMTKHLRLKFWMLPRDPKSVACPRYGRPAGEHAQRSLST